MVDSRCLPTWVNKCRSIERVLPPLSKHRDIMIPTSLVLPYLTHISLSTFVPVHHVSTWASAKHTSDPSLTPYQPPSISVGGIEVFKRHPSTFGCTHLVLLEVHIILIHVLL